MLDLKVWTATLAATAGVTFLGCIVWGLVTPAPLHMHAFLEAALPGFRWLSLPGLLLGLAESLLYGAYLGLVAVPLHNFFARRWGGRG